MKGNTEIFVGARSGLSFAILDQQGRVTRHAQLSTRSNQVSNRLADQVPSLQAMQIAERVGITVSELMHSARNPIVGKALFFTPDPNLSTGGKGASSPFPNADPSARPFEDKTAVPYDPFDVRTVKAKTKVTRDPSGFRTVESADDEEYVDEPDDVTDPLKLQPRRPGVIFPSGKRIAG